MKEQIRYVLVRNEQGHKFYYRGVNDIPEWTDDIWDSYLFRNLGAVNRLQSFYPESTVSKVKLKPIEI